MKHILAIDPGASGGFAWTYQESKNLFHCSNMPLTESGIIQFIGTFAETRPYVVLEHVRGFIGISQPGSAMFNFGENFGLIKGAVLMLGLKMSLVAPQKWQRATIPGKKKDFNYEHVLTKGKRVGQVVTKNRWKENLVEHATVMFPDNKVTPNNADALLILNYALKCFAVNQQP